MTFSLARRPRVVVSDADVVVVTSFNWDHRPPSGSRFRVHRRRSDWGLSRLRRVLLRLLDVASAVHATKGAKAVVLSTMGSDMALFSWSLRILRPRLKIVAFDVLVPRRRYAKPIATRMFRAIDGFAVIRSGDIATLATIFGVARASCTFIPFPVETRSLPPAGQGDYVYSAGWAHRDWPTLVASLERSRLPAIIAPDGISLASVPPDVRVVEMPPPEEERRLAGDSMCVVISMEDTHLPAGPLVLLDAMAMGKTVVATDVNGVRDYINPEETGILVPPKDAAALSSALLRVASSPELRHRLGGNARRAATTGFSPTEFWARLDEIIRNLVEVPSDPT